MKHFFCFFLTAVLLLSLLFAVFSVDLSFGQPQATVDASYATRNVTLHLVLPEGARCICTKTKQLVTSVPPIFSFPTSLFFGAFYDLLSEARLVFTSELAEVGSAS